MSRKRLDTVLAERGLYESRSRAAAAVIAGDVRLASGGGRLAQKPGQLVEEGVEVTLAEVSAFVSRGGIKLRNALDALGVPARGRRCLDVGASTGGFSDCLLQAGADHVTAVDVAYGELHWRIRNDPRVEVRERLNARALEPRHLSGAPPDLIVADLSFISLTRVLEPVLACAAGRFDCLALVKPQFEVGRARVGKGGVVRAAADRRAAFVAVGEHARALGYSVLGYAYSGLPGPAGNRESFVWIAEPGRDGALADLEAAAAEVER